MFVLSFYVGGGHCPFRGLDAPLRAGLNIGRSPISVNRIYIDSRIGIASVSDPACSRCSETVFGMVERKGIETVIQP